MNHLKFAFRQLLKSPGFTAVAVLTLALGIGLNAGIFTILNAVALRPLRVQGSERLVCVFQDFSRNRGRVLRNVYDDATRASYSEYRRYRDNNHVFSGLVAYAPSVTATLGGERPQQIVGTLMVFETRATDSSSKEPVAAPMLGEWRKQSSVFEGLAARGGDSFNLSGRGQAEALTGTRVSANMFSLLGLRPELGRDFLPEEETFGKHHVVLLSHEFWQGHFGGDTNIIGRIITLNSEPKTVIGIMPPRTHFPQGETQVWLPLAFEPWELRYRHAHNYLVLGKVKPGASFAQANAEMSLIAERMAAADAENKGWGAEVHGLQQEMVGHVQRVLLVLLGAVGLVLLIGCANIANLLLTRSTARAREFGIRAALGAGRSHLIRQLLTESLLLCAVGGLGGWLLATAGLAGLIHLSP